MTKTVEYSWDAWINSVDPDHANDKVNVVEYEFTARGLPLEPNGDNRLHQDGYRIFRANYKTRGAYASDE
jgi:hypothetical protein